MLEDMNLNRDWIWERNQDSGRAAVVGLESVDMEVPRRRRYVSISVFLIGGLDGWWLDDLLEWMFHETVGT
jgi:hypothetical protein